MGPAERRRIGLATVVVCADVDIRPLVGQATASDDASSASAAALARDLSAPESSWLLAVRHDG